MAKRGYATVIVVLCAFGCAKRESGSSAYFHRERLYDLATGAAKVRVFAGNYQFMLFDPSRNPFEPLPRITKTEVERGYWRNQNAIFYGTRAHNNDHRIDISLASRYEDNAKAERVLVNNLAVTSGMLAIFDHPNHIRFKVPPDDYSIYVRAYNLGKENKAGAAHLTDDEFFAHSEWERYEIVLVRGRIESEGELARSQSTEKK